MAAEGWEGLRDAGDLFAVLYDSWSAQADVNWVDTWRDQAMNEIETAADAIRADGHVADWLVPDGEDLQGQFVLLAAIDDALGDCHPRFGAGSYGNLVSVATRWPMTGNLVSGPEVPGGVVFRWAHPARPGSGTERLQDSFSFIIRVPPTEWSVLDPVLIPAQYDLPATVGSVEDLDFAFVPALYSFEDLEVESGVGMPGLPAANWYRMGPRADAVEPKLQDILRELDSAGAPIGILPEASLSPALLDQWRDLVRATPRPPGSNLRWILVGSGSFPIEAHPLPSNSAYLLHRDSGEILLEHKKFARFNFSASQISEWGLSGVLTDLPPIDEAIYQGQRATILESRLGRFAVLICEDVTRHGEAVADAIFASGPNLVIVPILARSLKRHHWEEYAAKTHVALGGATVAIANSLAILDAEARFGTPADDATDAFCALALTPNALSDDLFQIAELTAGSLLEVLPRR